uniref:Scavenger receptor class B, member 2a n=1 Tax=Oryzias sinensis TaxID=183150 RepID=A0A8C7XUS7_9TELE
MINGTDGAVFHPLINRNELLYIFAADLCRSIHLAYVEDVEVKGIQAFRFAPPEDVLMSPKDNPANAGFCVPAGDCLGTGVLKVSVCREGAPIVVSFPHFYQADPKYINAVEGMNPNKDEHETYLDLQPTTGVPIRACKRAQLNIIVKRIPGFPKTRHINETIFPIMFVNEVRRSSDPRSERQIPAPTHAFPLCAADGDHRRRVGSSDEDAAPHRHAGLQLPRVHRGHGHHPAARARRSLLPKPPEEGKERPQ